MKIVTANLHMNKDHLAEQWEKDIIKEAKENIRILEQSMGATCTIEPIHEDPEYAMVAIKCTVPEENAEQFMRIMDKKLGGIWEIE